MARLRKDQESEIMKAAKEAAGRGAPAFRGGVPERVGSVDGGLVSIDTEGLGRSIGLRGSQAPRPFEASPPLDAPLAATQPTPALPEIGIGGPVTVPQVRQGLGATAAPTQAPASVGLKLAGADRQGPQPITGPSFVEANDGQRVFLDRGVRTATSPELANLERLQDQKLGLPTEPVDRFAPAEATGASSVPGVSQADLNRLGARLAGSRDRKVTALTDDLIATGLSPAEAKQQAELEITGTSSLGGRAEARVTQGLRAGLRAQKAAQAEAGLKTREVAVKEVQAQASLDQAAAALKNAAKSGKGSKFKFTLGKADLSQIPTTDPTTGALVYPTTGASVTIGEKSFPLSKEDAELVQDRGRRAAAVLAERRGIPLDEALQEGYELAYAAILDQRSKK